MLKKYRVPFNRMQRAAREAVAATLNDVEGLPISREMLVETLADFEGTMLFVSHDRSFLRSISNRVLELEGGEPRVYGGGYKEYVVREAPGLAS